MTAWFKRFFYKRKAWCHPVPDRSGFTLTEILVVLVVLIIGVLPLAVFQSQARRDVSRSDTYTRAITMAQERLETMRSVGFGNAAPDTGEAGQLQWATNVQNVGFGLDRLTVTVVWTEGNRVRTVQMANMISMR
jgi:prepilin-type N-terminal cleavage/methylation domain-containing protein